MNGNNENEVPMSPGANNRIRALAASYNATANQSHIPLPQWKASLQSNSELTKWKNKYEEAEKKRKALLTQSQKSKSFLENNESYPKFSSGGMSYLLNWKQVANGKVLL